jgi:signal transduction histidine kinase/DNA-binding response OmpR family regulator/ligand-binding sensor domain-containing protein
MKKVKLIIVITLVYICNSGIFASKSYVFHHLSTGDGMSNNSAKSLLRDSYGFLWVGTEFGLNRYDGYNFKIFLANPGVPHQLPGNDIQGLQEDGLKNIWIDLGYQYTVYDRAKDCFVSNVNTILEKLNIHVAGSIKVYIDKNKNLFVINGNKINYYNTSTKTLRVYGSPRLNIPNLEISDDVGNLYVIDSNKFCWKINKNSGKTEKIPLPTDSEINCKTGHVIIFADHRGGLWLFSRNSERLYFKPSSLLPWQQIFLNSNIKLQNNIIAIVERKNDQIWIATDHKGVFRYNKSDNSMINITSDPLVQSSMASNNVSAILIDNTGTVWLGHDKKGISFFNESFQNFVNIQHDQCRDISRIIELSNGNILFGTDGNGLFIDRFAKSEIAKLPVPNTAIVAMIEDKQDRVWVGTFQQGLYCIDHDKLNHFTTQNSNLSSDNIWGLTEDKYGNIWIGTLGGKIHKYTAGNNSNIFEILAGDNIYVSDMIYDGDETVYATTAYGLTSIDILKNTTRVFLGNKKGTQQFIQQQLFNVYKDSRNLLWIGTNSGLTIWNVKKDTLYNFNFSNGLCDNIIRGIVEDNLHNIWVATSNGLSVLSILKNGDRLEIINSKNFSIKDGLKSNYFNNHSICKLQNGNILVGTTEGYTIFDPKKIAKRKHPLSRIYFTRISIGNTPIFVDSVYNGHVVLSKSIEQTQLLDLKYNDNLITLEFATPDLINADKVKYLYKIEGFNNQWISTKKNEINITSLPSGKYKLLVKACNADGVWNNEAKVLQINVAPPFYLSFWAIALYVLLILVMVEWTIRRGKRRHQLKLEEQRRQMSHEHELRINDMKLRFFTNISHDLRTPLTLIITPLQTLIKETPDALLKKKLEVMFKNAQQLLALINSLLDFRKLDVGAETLHSKPGNIVDLVNEIYTSFDVYASERGINFIRTMNFKTLWLEYDPDKIQKSIVNLLSNAFKYTPDGGEIRLSLYIQGSDVCISVSDSGIGISDEDKKVVFNRFYQIENNLRTTGSGIGLHIVSEYIKLHHGTIEIADNNPGGCVFTLRFPKIEAPCADHSEELIPEMVEGLPDKVLLPAKPVVLFVDDNHDLCEFIRDNLKNDYSLVIANDGQEAIVLLKQNDVSIVVSDIMMPVMDGIELCKQIKTNIQWSHIPVILLTARTTEEHKLEGLELGADDYITKPFNLDILKLRILKFIEWSLRSHKAFKQKLDVNPHDITITPLDEKLIAKAIKIVEDHIADAEFSVEMLGDTLGLSRGHLYKKLIAITGKGPAEFIRTIRLKRAVQLLEKSQLQISEIAYDVGFNSPKRFTINFKDEFGLSPSEYLRKLKKEKLESESEGE